MEKKKIEEVSRCCGYEKHIDNSNGTNFERCGSCGIPFIPKPKEEYIKSAMECAKCGRTSLVVHLDDKCPFCEHQEEESWEENERTEFYKYAAWFGASGLHGKDLLKGYADYIIGRLHSSRTKAYTEIDCEISKLLAEFANTPLDKRTTGWEWLLKLRTIINGRK